jgi:hypothetical protein
LDQQPSEDVQRQLAELLQEVRTLRDDLARLQDQVALLQAPLTKSRSVKGLRYLGAAMYVAVAPFRVGLVALKQIAAKLAKVPHEFSISLVLWSIAYWACFVYVALRGGKGRPRRAQPPPTRS